MNKLVTAGLDAAVVFAKSRENGAENVSGKSMLIIVNLYFSSVCTCQCNVVT